jgi:hypothetical protein
MPLAIVEVLEKKGPVTDIDLQKEPKSNFEMVSFRELNRKLMKTELAEVLRVSRLMKGKRQVELIGKPTIDWNNVQQGTPMFLTEGSSFTNLPSRVQGPRFWLLNGNPP